jgi:hypothetical protein
MEAFTGAISDVFRTVGTNPAAVMCFTHAVQQPQFGSLYTVIALGTPGGKMGPTPSIESVRPIIARGGAPAAAASPAAAALAPSARRKSRREGSADPEGVVMVGSCRTRSSEP